MKADDDAEIDEAAADYDDCDEKTGPTSTGTTVNEREDDDGNENGEHRVGERSTERRLT